MTEYWIWLSVAMHGASIKTDELINKFSNPKNVYENRHTLLKNGFPVSKSEHKSIMNKDIDVAYDIMEKADKLGVEILTPDSKNFPQCFKEIVGVPLALFTKGNVELLSDPLKATIVGTRKPTEYAVAATYRLGYDLAKAGVTIVSGCAKGIDYVAHKSAINAGGKTVGVLACGMDIDYPTNHGELKNQIIENGVLISEYPFGVTADPSHFAPRNRLLAALSLGTIVTQAPEKSGALLTASHAIDQGKDVYAIPDSIFSSNAVGSMKLIKDGAYLITHCYDFIMNYIHRFAERIDLDSITEKTDFLEIKDELLGAAVHHYYRPQPKKPIYQIDKNKEFVPLSDTASDTARKIYNLLLENPMDIDVISANLNIDTTEIYSEITMLELDGCIAQENDVFYIPQI